MFEHSAQEAIAANQLHQATPVFSKVVDAVIALAGMANSMRDEVARIGVAHALHNSMTYHPELHHAFLHGELVGFGLVVQSYLDDAAPGNGEQAHLLALLTAFATPLTLRQLGIITSGAELAQKIRHIAEGVKIAPAIAARLPFTLTTERIEHALTLTAALDAAPRPAHGETNAIYAALSAGR